MTRKILGFAMCLLMAVTILSGTASANPISNDGVYKGVKLCGKVKVVGHFADFKVKVVDHFPDLKVKVVEHFPDAVGKWQFVEAFPDFTVEFVQIGEDFKIQYVDAFPGVN